MKKQRKEFPQPDGSVFVYESDGKSRKRYYLRDGKPIAPPTAENHPKQTNTPAASTPARTTPKRETRYDCVHIEGSTGQTTKHLCGGCPGGQVATVFTCELFGECLPAAWAPTPESTARRCLDCGRYQKEAGD